MVKANLVAVVKTRNLMSKYTREIARDFNRCLDDVYPIPEVLIGDVVPLLVSKATLNGAAVSGQLIFIFPTRKLIIKSTTTK
jgi:hypothetical protein